MGKASTSIHGILLRRGRKISIVSMRPYKRHLRNTLNNSRFSPSLYDSLNIEGGNATNEPLPTTLPLVDFGYRFDNGQTYVALSRYLLFIVHTHRKLYIIIR